jgi:hypothetical protein
LEDSPRDGPSKLNLLKVRKDFAKTVFHRAPSFPFWSAVPAIVVTSSDSGKLTSLISQPSRSATRRHPADARADFLAAFGSPLSRFQETPFC